jgi:hypothetical protein
MRKLLSLTIFLLSLSVLSTTSTAAPISVGKDDTVQSILLANMGKRVTVILESGQELSGKVTTVSAHATHISQLTGKEFYDAVVSTKGIIAVVIRVK